MRTPHRSVLPMLLRPVVAAAACLLFVAACDPVPSGAKRRSQPALVVQRLGDTKVSVRYNRPSARGRELFGGIVPWDSVWNPGADEATRLSTTSDLAIGDRVLAAGAYSIWMIPDSAAPWTVIFSRAADVPHVPYPEGEDALRLRIAPQRTPYVETLSFSFPAATPDSALLLFQWGETMIPIRLHPR